MVKRLWMALPALLLAGGCAVNPVSPPGPYAAVTPQMAAAGTDTGSRVRWGGVIVDVHPEKARTCFEVLGLPLDGDGRPEREHSLSEGRFIACSPGFYDPALYAKGREITVAGDITKVETHHIGGYAYRFPVVDAGAPHLWPRELPVRYLPGPCWNDPFCGPWGWPGPYPYAPWWR
ncbi:hypothetical protein BJI67_02040 [Acidihalobacter aeolianus]|uniref:Outer membrane lipoprotein n=1 Tax=Acidihalobacter aeolianus TaxID=2792603 RepID=A0A1D8K4X0_9GAMM|nr:Slp family lipoprotein [Acidihalobacter aeolianus]AOV16013.1 hypothetical protein BJI67_02040 [Acidihalobacter aeolianus]